MSHGLRAQAGGRAFFMHSAANVSEALGATRRVVFGGYGGRVVSRNAGAFDTLQPQVRRTRCTHRPALWCKGGGMRSCAVGVGAWCLAGSCEISRLGGQSKSH